MLLKGYKEKRKESKAFKKIVAKQTLQARRKAYAEEAVIQANIRGKELAKRKTERRKQAAAFGKNLERAVVKKILSPPKGKYKKRTISTARKSGDFNQAFRDQPVPVGF